MTTPPWLDEALSVALRLTLWQQFGLAFLLGSFTVATLSDLKRLSAQREFLEVWLLLLLAVLAFDAWRAHDGQASVPVLFVKWGLILGLSVLSLKGVGVLFRLAPGDVAALATAAALLTPALVVLLYLAAKALALVLGPLLARGRPFYPFMPVVSLATLTVLAVGLAF